MTMDMDVPKLRNLVGMHDSNDDPLIMIAVADLKILLSNWEATNRDAHIQWLTKGEARCRCCDPPLAGIGYVA